MNKTITAINELKRNWSIKKINKLISELEIEINKYLGESND